MFNMGDRVKVSDKYLDLRLVGKVGTVKGFHIYMRRKYIGVEFDEQIIDGHDFCGRCTNGVKGKDGHCWFFVGEQLEKINEEGLDV